MGWPVIQQSIPRRHDILDPQSYIWVIRPEVVSWLADQGVLLEPGWHSNLGSPVAPRAGRVEFRFPATGGAGNGVMCWNDLDAKVAILFKLTWL
jgi:hypothetical protein